MMRADRLFTIQFGLPVEKLLVVLLATMVVAGCSNSKLRRTPTQVKDTPWFCQMDEARSDWECVQDESLVKNPKPERLPNDPMEKPVRPVSVTDASPVTGSTGRAPELTATVASATAEGGDLSDTAHSSASIDAEDMPAAETRDGSAAARLLAMSAERFAVQLIALDSAELAERFIEENALEDAMVVQLARQEDFYYVVIFGIYDSFEEARAAFDANPGSLEGIKPWIRSLGSLQAAIRQADILLTGVDSQNHP